MRNSKYIVDPNGEHRAGCFGNAIRYGVGIPMLLFLLWVLFSLVGCKTVGTVSENVNVRDSAIDEEIKRIKAVAHDIVIIEQ